MNERQLSYLHNSPQILIMIGEHFYISYPSVTSVCSFCFWWSDMIIFSFLGLCVYRLTLSSIKCFCGWYYFTYTDVGSGRVQIRFRSRQFSFHWSWLVGRSQNEVFPDFCQKFVKNARIRNFWGYPGLNLTTLWKAFPDFWLIFAKKLVKNTRIGIFGDIQVQIWQNPVKIL